MIKSISCVIRVLKKYRIIRAKKKFMFKTKKSYKKRFIPHFYSVAISSRPSVSVSIYFEDKHFVHLFVPCSNMFVPWPSYSTTDFLPVGDFVMYSRWVRPQDGVYCLFFLYVFPSFVSCCYRTLTKLHTHALLRFISWCYDGDDLCFVFPFPIVGPEQSWWMWKDKRKKKPKKYSRVMMQNLQKLYVFFLISPVSNARVFAETCADRQCQRDYSWILDCGPMRNWAWHITKSPGFNACRFMCLLASVLFLKQMGRCE